MKIDLHIHSSEVSPCGRLTVEDLLELYSKTDYDGFVLTNHFSAYACGKAKEKGYDFHQLYHDTIRKAQELGKKRNFLVLPGYELRFAGSDNDYLVYGMKEEDCVECEKLFAMNPAEFSKFAAGRGILFYQAHPFRNGMDIIPPQHLFGIEVNNGHPRHDSRNDIALAWAEKYGLRKIGGSDCHEATDVGSSGIVTERKVETISDLVEVLSENSYTII